MVMRIYLIPACFSPFNMYSYASSNPIAMASSFFLPDYFRFRDHSHVQNVLFKMNKLQAISRANGNHKVPHFFE